MCTYNITLDDQLVAEAECKLKADLSFQLWLQQEVEAMLKKYVGKPRIGGKHKVAKIKRMPVDRSDGELEAIFSDKHMPELPSGDATWQDIIRGNSGRTIKSVEKWL